MSPFGGDEGIRTPDPLLAGQVLSQLSYTPIKAARTLKAEQQHYTLKSTGYLAVVLFCLLSSHRKYRSLPLGTPYVLLRKEVIQPHLPIRLPCYDLTPIIEPTFGCCPLAVSSQTSGLPDFHGLTGGVYKARERIHRDILIRDY